MKSPRLGRGLASMMLAMQLVLTGCAGLGQPSAPEEIVRERASAWATALIDGDIKTAFSYTSPGYRMFSDWGRYHARVQGASSWKTATLREVICTTETACEVTFILEYSVAKMGVDIRRPRTYTWVLSDGQWWLYVPPS